MIFIPAPPLQLMKDIIQIGEKIVFHGVKSSQIWRREKERANKYPEEEKFWAKWEKDKNENILSPKETKKKKEENIRMIWSKIAPFPNVCDLKRCEIVVCYCFICLDHEIMEFMPPPLSPVFRYVFIGWGK